HKVPHCYLGNLCYFEDCRLFIFFPDLYCQDSERIFLTDNEYSRFIDILLQAIHDVYSSGVSQHFPRNWEEAKLKGKARAVEQGVKLEKAEPRIQMFHYTVPPKGLYEVWNIVL
ncbi:hypothetical protein BGX38DRAFT_1068413, partial [Terfezia claveryi]